MNITRADCVPLVLRLVTGIGLVAHGLAKLNRGPGVFAATLDAMRVPAPTLMVWATILIELVGGLAVLAGAAIWLVGVPGVVHGRGPDCRSTGYELTLFYLACLAALALSGPGPLSVDRAFARRRRSPSPRALPEDA